MSSPRHGERERERERRRGCGLVKPGRGLVNPGRGLWKDRDGLCNVCRGLWFGDCKEEAPVRPAPLLLSRSRLRPRLRERLRTEVVEAVTLRGVRARCLSRAVSLGPSLALSALPTRSLSLCSRAEGVVLSCPVLPLSLREGV